MNSVGNLLRTGGLEMKYPILCKDEIGFQDLKNEIAILCNQENAVETPVEPASLAEATTEPNDEKEAQKQR